MTPFIYLEPTSLDEALEFLARHGDEAKLMAGGTALVNLMKERLVEPAIVIGLRAIKHLTRVEEQGVLRVGSLATLQALATSATVQAAAPLLAEACGHVATVRVRSMATLGGALAHGDPHLDMPPAVIALDGRISIRSRRGQREVPADQFFTGYFETALEPDELVTDIVLPAQPAHSGAAFIKFLSATQDDYATVSVAVRVVLDESGAMSDARVALGSIGLTPVRAVTVENALHGRLPGDAVFREAAALVLDAIEPIANFRGSVAYKRDMAVVHVRRALAQAAARIHAIA